MLVAAGALTSVPDRLADPRPRGPRKRRATRVVRPPDALAGRAVFSAGDTKYTWTDVVEAARLHGGWASLEGQGLAGLACVRRLASNGEDLDRSALAASARGFRSARHLLAGDEMAAWLAHWGLAVADVRDYLVREHLRERWATDLDETTQRYPVPRDAVEAVLWAEAVCSGFVERTAQVLAGDIALAIESGELRLGDRYRGLSPILAIAARMRAAAASEEEIEHEIAAHRLEWTRVGGVALALGSIDAAREAALRIREDGASIDQVAAEAGVETTAFRVYLTELDDGAATALLDAQEGDLVGPRASAGRFVLRVLERKDRPAPSDVEVREKAVERLLARAVERAVSSHVEWHERL
jgi:hypothetical protein